MTEESLLLAPDAALEADYRAFNIASIRVMEKNGGLLAGEGISPIDGKPTRRYWIEQEN